MTGNFHWFESRDFDALFIGVLEEPIGEILKSGSGKRWWMISHLPGVKLDRPYLPRLEARAYLEKAVNRWLEEIND